jgi:hypothetical protein
MQEAVTDIIIVIVNFNSKMYAMEVNFTTQTLDVLGAQYPGKNLLVYHNQDLGYDLCKFYLFLLRAIFGWLPSGGGVHYHKEVPIDSTLRITQGYEIWVFDYGTFELVGDGGWENWGCAGCFTRLGANVNFTKCWEPIQYYSTATPTYS